MALRKTKEADAEHLFAKMEADAEMPIELLVVGPSPAPAQYGASAPRNIASRRSQNLG